MAMPSAHGANANRESGHSCRAEKQAGGESVRMLLQPPPRSAQVGGPNKAGPLEEQAEEVQLHIDRAEDLLGPRSGGGGHLPGLVLVGALSSAVAREVLQGNPEVGPEVDGQGNTVRKARVSPLRTCSPQPPPGTFPTPLRRRAGERGRGEGFRARLTSEPRGRAGRCATR